MAQDPNNPTTPPQILKNLPTGAVTGGTAAAILAALGWIVQEFVDIQRTMERLETKMAAQTLAITTLTTDVQGDVNAIRDRVLLLEREVFGKSLRMDPR